MFIFVFHQALEKRLAGILREAYSWCPTVEAQLRLLEVFEGISSRELVQVSPQYFSFTLYSVRIKSFKIITEKVTILVVLYYL